MYKCICHCMVEKHHHLRKNALPCAWFYRWKLWFQYKWRIILWNTNGKLVGDGKNEVWKTGKILQRFYNMYMHIFKQDSFVIIEIFHFFSANTGYSSTSASTLTTLSNNTSHLTVPQSSISPSLSPTSTVVSSTEIENIIANKKKL